LWKSRAFVLARILVVAVTRIKEDQEPEIMEDGLFRPELVEFWGY
jgi:hypothetical protein